jgi:hypothetical protein
VSTTKPFTVCHPGGWLIAGEVIIPTRLERRQRIRWEPEVVFGEVTNEEEPVEPQDFEEWLRSREAEGGARRDIEGELEDKALEVVGLGPSAEPDDDCGPEEDRDERSERPWER